MPPAKVKPDIPQIKAVETAISYAEGVVKGEVIAGKLVKLAAKRFLRDLKHGHERGLTLRHEEAQHVVTFFGQLRHSKGAWGAGGGKVFVLSPWQTFILVNMFGWYQADGTRRFREAYIEVARKNGKSTFIAGIGLYMLVCDMEPGAEVYSAATKKDQAKIVFEEAERMVKKSDFLRKRVNNPRGNLNVVESNSKFEPLSSEDDTLDGLNGHCILIDELHAHPTRKLYDVLRESIIARTQPIVWVITTAGYDRTGICYKQREYAEKVLVGQVYAADCDYFFAFVACMDAKDKEGNVLAWDDERNWAMANPNLNISVRLEALRQAASKAKLDPTALNSFLRKHLNVWTSQDIRWMPPDKWAACNHAGPLINPLELRGAAMERLKGRLCYAAFDLSSKIDLTALVLLFPPQKKVVRRQIKDQTLQEKIARKPVETFDIVLQEEDLYWTVIPFFFVPMDNVEERVKNDRVEYDVWIKQGYITATPGNVVDQRKLRELLIDLRTKYQIIEVGYDSWNASQISVDLKEDSFTVRDIRQGFKTLSEPMKEVMALVLSKRIEHLGNPVLGWNILNLQADQDAAGNIKPDKDKSKERIDGGVALIMALACATQHPSDSGGSVYNDRGIVFM